MLWISSTVNPWFQFDALAIYRCIRNTQFDRCFLGAIRIFYEINHCLHPFPVPSKSCLLSAHLSTIRGVFPLSDFTLKSENLLHIIELFERCCSNRRGFTVKPPKPVDLHTIDNFLKELKSYSLVLFPGTAATVLFEIVRKSGNFLTCETKCCVISCGWFFHLTVSCFRGKVPIGSACPLSSNSAVHCAFLPYRSCFLQLLWRVMFILHTLYLLSGSLTTMSLACSPIASPVSFLLALFL